MKLLASLLGCAVADYACCPYDEFGIVNPGCPLSEKTPWAMQSGNTVADPAGVSNHVCKAWEANIDATMEGNEDFDNWGGCGFQRHFPWGILDAKTGDTTNPDFEHCRMGMFTCPASPGVVTNNYLALQIGSTNFPLATGAFSNGGLNAVFGQVTLGGVCKLWIPVRLGSIDSVSIAGVHMNGGGTTATADHGAAAVFDDAKICTTADCTTTTGIATGTAYCFSVVNIAEFMENNMPSSAFRVMNANVAGKDAGGHDAILLPGPAFEEAFLVDFKSSIEPGVAGGTDTIVDAGASFDVVVHFKSKWCIRHWDITDMQVDTDVNGDDLDYTLEGTPPVHAHTDVADKRISGAIGVCGCCLADGVTRHDSSTHTTIGVSGCAKCDGNDGVGGTGCDEFNTYAAMVPSNMQWPNAGAWAAFYSFITCANSDFMIYHTAGAIVGGAITTTTKNRKLVHSMFYNDIRHDYSNAHSGTGTIVIRGNFRQIGDAVTNCGPGVVPTTDSKRCTWNWNFITNTDAETWFERDNPINHVVWNSPNTINHVNTPNALPGLITSIVEHLPFVLTFQDDTDAATGSGAPAVHALTIDAAKYFTTPTPTIAAAGHSFDFTMVCLLSSLDGNGAAIVTPGDTAALGGSATTNIRDLFPDCYMGDEVHFEYTITDTLSTNPTVDHRISSWYSYVTGTNFNA